MPEQRRVQLHGPPEQPNGRIDASLGHLLELLRAEQVEFVGALMVWTPPNGLT